MFVDLGPPQYQMIGGSSINNMKSVGYSYRSYSHVEANKAWSDVACLQNLTAQSVVRLLCLEGFTLLLVWKKA